MDSSSIKQVPAVLNVLSLTNLITTTTQNTTTHKNNCNQLTSHVEMIRNLLEKMKSTDLMILPEMQEPLECLEDALNMALDLVECCRERSYMYLVSMGWSVVYQFRHVQNEIDLALKALPLVSLAHQFRIQNVKESLQAIEEDHCQYTLDEEDVQARTVILNPDRSKKDANILEKSLSRIYPESKFNEALQEEKEKLHVELERSQAKNDTKQCRLIEQLIEVTENVVNMPLEKNLALNTETYIGPSYVSTRNFNNGANGLQSGDWQADLFDCCSEPCLSLKACIYPCGIFSWIAHVVSKGKITRERALNDLMAYSLFCGCCCYTCCVRKKLRQLLNIEGGSADDFLTHLMCCCCAMVQEWRELELRDFEGCQGRKMIPPPYQYMRP